ncbi:hypothetical protein KAW65_08420 [candidate division WOR-3 bacterium]|nr:hypothetical protein [candidate division WOR-3 bacterium]
MQNDKSLKATIVIPTYWTAEEFIPSANNPIYDHPTPLNSEGTLGRLLDSMKILKEKDFDVMIISVPTSQEIGKVGAYSNTPALIKKKVDAIIEPFKKLYNIHHFSYPDLLPIHKKLKELGKKEYIPYFSLDGYSNIRNMCLILPHILGTDIVILIDDDEVFEDPDFIKKAHAFIGKNEIYGIAGCYIQPYGGYKFKGKREWWKFLWNNTGAMNKVFELIETPAQIEFVPTYKLGRLKETPFAGGGNMVIHKNLFTKVSFDPWINRGEDVDFLCNSKIAGFKFLLDTKLSILHLPPANKNPLWLQLREDIRRFIYMRIKLLKQGYSIKRTMPYPGYFLKFDLYFKIFITNRILAGAYFLKGQFKESVEFLKNILLVFKFRKEAYINYQKFINFSKGWPQFMNWLEKNRDLILSKIPE